MTPWPALAAYRGLTYDDVDCSTLTSQLVDAWYGPLPEPVRRHIVLSEGSAWAPVEAVRDHLGAHVPGGDPEQPWTGRMHLMQGWRHLGPGDAITPASRGHAWLWLSAGGWEGVCIESSGSGPRIWDGYGRRPIERVVSADGRLSAPLMPMDLSERTEAWERVRWAVLPSSTEVTT